MKPEGSLPHSQVPATCPYIKPARSGPCLSYPTSWRSMLILSSHLRLGLPSVPFLSGFPTHQNPVNTSSLPHTCHMPHSPGKDTNNQNFTFEKFKNILNTGRGAVTIRPESFVFPFAVWRRKNLYRNMHFLVRYGCETWYVTLKERQWLSMYEKRVLRKIFGPKWDEVTGEWRRLLNGEILTKN
jgi:hypothetical protein